MEVINILTGQLGQTTSTSDISIAELLSRYKYRIGRVVDMASSMGRDNTFSVEDYFMYDLQQLSYESNLKEISATSMIKLRNMILCQVRALPVPIQVRFRELEFDEILPSNTKEFLELLFKIAQAGYTDSAAAIIKEINDSIANIIEEIELIKSMIISEYDSYDNYIKFLAWENNVNL